MFKMERSFTGPKYPYSKWNIESSTVRTLNHLPKRNSLSRSRAESVFIMTSRILASERFYSLYWKDKRLLSKLFLTTNILKFTVNLINYKYSTC